MLQVQGRDLPMEFYIAVDKRRVLTLSVYVTGPGKTIHIRTTTEIQLNIKATLKYCLGTPSMCV